MRLQHPLRLVEDDASTAMTVSCLVGADGQEVFFSTEALFKWLFNVWYFLNILLEYFLRAPGGSSKQGLSVLWYTPLCLSHMGLVTHQWRH